MSRDAQATREKLVAAARRAFSERGFERTTVREIAGDAGVNPALINRYFGSKEQLFAEAVSIDLAFPPLGDVAKDEIGERLVAHFFRRWEGSEEDDLLRVLVRSAATNEEAAGRMRDIFAGQIVAMVARVAGPDKATERAALIATQVLGLAYLRYVLGLGEDRIARATLQTMVGATLQRYLFDPLP